jgi:hypothetical protein
MSTSGSYSFTLTKTNIIARAFQLINVYDLNSTIDSDDYSYASDALNLMLKSWEAEGIHLWKRRQATLFPALNQYQYQLGSVSGADNVANTYVATTVATAVTNASSTVIVNSVTGMAIGNFVGLELDDGTRQWGTISNIVSKTLTVSFTTTTTAAVNNTVIVYSAKINRPLKFIRATTIDLNNSNAEVTLQDLNFDDYFDLPVKNSPGRPVNYYYDYVLNNGLSYTGSVFLYPQPNDVSVLLNFTYYDSIQDMINNTDNADLPQEWLKTIVWNLACDLATAYGKLTELQQLAPAADKLKLMLERFDNDDSALRIRPDNNDSYPRM